MCGIAGFLDIKKRYSRREMEAIATRMADTMRHRGPDHRGVWCDPEAGIALAHRRLAILDLSHEGHQPMLSASRRFVIAFNGEVYNYPAVRRQLEGSAGEMRVHWRGHSDTEVMLEAISRWGLERALERLNGMFAFSLWDKEDRVLHLVRDRLGEKPLYYGWVRGMLIFASELKALQKHPAWAGVVDRDSLALFLRYNCIPAPRSIYKDVFKLLPGNLLRLAIPTDGKETGRSVRAYWSAKDIAETGSTDPFTGSDEDAIRELDRLLREAVRMRMDADVPLGAFLSGGTDSSTVVALMQDQSPKPVRTFSIGYHEPAYNEAHLATHVAKHLGTEHTELYTTPEEAMAVVPRLPTLYDEPFSDSSQIPTFLVSELARRHVTVSLSGDGGDELFGGYNRHFWAPKLWGQLGWIPRSLRAMLGRALTKVSPNTWDRVFGELTRLFPSYSGHRIPGDKLHKLARVLASRNLPEMYGGLTSHWRDPATLVLGATEPETALSDPSQWAQLVDFSLVMMYLDLVAYLPNDILVKLDRATMGISLEARVPFLDHRVVEFAWRLPLNLRIRNGQGKWILRQVLHTYVPRELIERPKMGFGVPIDSWLRGPLREWAEEFLCAKRLKREGFLRPGPIRRKWTEHLSGRRNWQHELWDVLMFQAWLDHHGA